MSAHENRRSGLTVFLHYYTVKTCLHEKIVFYPGERRRIRISAARLGTAHPVEFLLEREGEAWKADGGIISQETFFVLKTQAFEEVMVILSGTGRRLMPCGKILLHAKTEVSVGKDFRNEIFYDCFSFIESRHIRIYREGKDFVLERPDREKEEVGLYVNGSRFSEKIILKKGDRMELWGLSVLYLPDLLICSAFYGTLRTAEGKETFPAPDRRKEERRVRMLTDHSQPGETLHTGEFELSMPQSMRPPREGPAALTLGPSVTMMLPMILTAVLGSAMMGEAGADYYKISIVMALSTGIFSIFWGIVNHEYRKRSSLAEMVRNKDSYREYLTKTEKYLSSCLLENQSVLERKYPSCESILEGCGRVLWNRTGFQKDFLFIRLGLREIPFQIHVKSSMGSRGPDQDLLTREAHELMDRFRMLPAAPVGINLEEAGIVGFAGSRIYPVLVQALVQLAACHGSRDMKIAFFYEEGEEEERRIAQCLKWLPHIWSRGRKVRFLAGNETEAGEILPELSKEITEVGTREGRHPFYVVVAANRRLTDGEAVGIFAGGENAEVYPVFVERKRERLPGCCRVLVIRDGQQEEIIFYEKESARRQILSMEECADSSAQEYMRKMAGVRQPGEEEDLLAEKVSFLDLYSCKDVDGLNCCGRWRENRTGERMRVPVGMGRGVKRIFLDIHEKFHGPHGLVAGTTGSGKSELLLTYLLSLAVSFGPEDINFFIIDYKGGGMGNTLCSLPHCAGVVSNLSGRQIKRALASIKSENRRRQSLFHRAGVNHVEDYACLYREGKVEEPVPHLLLVVDEFAELKKEEPEFMQEIISVAQVGRSLGVHLILSTQKPAGTVDDKIWSNTRFRLCLRVADRQDSIDMLRRPDAAYLTGAGQCYLQVGNQEIYELFQAGYGGGEYEETGDGTDGVFLLQNTGKRVRGEGREKRRGPTQMEAVIAYIGQTARQTLSGNARALWMPELPETLYLDELRAGEERGEGEIRLCLGLCDDPECQMQYPLYYDPAKEGNLFLAGGSATGKSTLLQTLLWQLCGDYSPQQVRILLAGADHAGVGCFEAMPHCLGIMRGKEEAECFFYHLEKLFEARREMLKGISFWQYRKHNGPESVLFLVIDGYGGFREMTQDAYQSLIEHLAGEGINYGIYLILTASGAGGGDIPGKLFEKMKTSLAFEMSDRFQYGDILRRYQTSVWPKENVKGRGLCRISERILEFQVPLVAPGDDYQRIERIEELVKRWDGACPDIRRERFPVVPAKPCYHSMLRDFAGQETAEGDLPIGYEEISGYIKTVSLKEGDTFLISGAPQTGKRNLLLCMMEGIWKLGGRTALIDRKRMLGARALEAASIQGQEERLTVISDGASFASWYCGRKDRQEGWYLCLCDLADFTGMLCGYEEEIREAGKELEQRLEQGRLFPVIALQCPGKETEAFGTPLFEQFVKCQCGVHLGGNVDNQRMLAMDDLGYTQMSRALAPGNGFYKSGPYGRTERIRIPLYDDISGYSDSRS